MLMNNTVFFLVLCIVVICYPAYAGGNPADHYEGQIEMMAKLYGDRFSEEFSEAREVCTLRLEKSDYEFTEPLDLTFISFSLEGFRGGNNYTRYLSVFSGKRLLGSTPIGGKGWRNFSLGDCSDIQPKHTSGWGSFIFIFASIEYSDKDPMCCPSKIGSVSVFVSRSRGVSEILPDEVLSDFFLTFQN